MAEAGERLWAAFVSEASLVWEERLARVVGLLVAVLAAGWVKLAGRQVSA